jgi:hypothetical protein
MSTTDAQADREIIREAAAAVRHTAAQDQYRGEEQPTAGFAMALLLDELALHATSLPDALRTAVADHCRTIVREALRKAGTGSFGPVAQGGSEAHDPEDLG